MAGVPLHGILAMIGELRVEPFVQRRHERGILRLVIQLATGFGQD